MTGPNTPVLGKAQDGKPGPDPKTAQLEAVNQRMKELAAAANAKLPDPLPPDWDMLYEARFLIARIEAQNRLNGMALQQLALAGGGGGGLKEILREAGDKLEPYANIFRNIEAAMMTLDAKVNRLEANLKADVESRGRTYQL